MLKKFLKNEKGLTLIELLAVVVILGIIAAIAVPSIGAIIQKSKDDGVRADALQVLSSAKLYVAANGAPAPASGVTYSEITETQLSEYLDNVALNTTTGDDYTVRVAADGTYTLTASAVTVGKTTITITDATVAQLRDKKFTGKETTVAIP